MSNLLENTSFRLWKEDIKASVFESKINPLIVIRQNGEKSFYKTSTEKSYALKNINFETDLVLFTRSGQWSSDVFQFKKEDFIAMGYLFNNKNLG